MGHLQPLLNYPRNNPLSSILRAELPQSIQAGMGRPKYCNLGFWQFGDLQGHACTISKHRAQIALSGTSERAVGLCWLPKLQNKHKRESSGLIWVYTLRAHGFPWP